MRQMKNINSTQYNIQNNNSFEEVKIRSPKKLFKFKKVLNEYWLFLEDKKKLRKMQVPLNQTET